MIKKENTSPATIADLGLVQDGLMTAIDGVNCTLKAELAVVKDDVAVLKTDVSDLRRELRAEAEATRRHFDLVAERLVTHTSRQEDKIENHDHRIVELERRAGMVA